MNSFNTNNYYLNAQHQVSPMRIALALILPSANHLAIAISRRLNNNFQACNWTRVRAIAQLLIVYSSHALAVLVKVNKHLSNTHAQQLRKLTVNVKIKQLMLLIINTCAIVPTNITWTQLQQMLMLITILVSVKIRLLALALPTALAVLLPFNLL